MPCKQFTPQQAEKAHKILEELSHGNVTNSAVASDADFFPAYIAMFAKAEATMKPGSDMNMCLSRDEMDRFLEDQLYWPIRVRIARHIANCPRCYRYFLDIEGKTFELPDSKRRQS